MALDIQKARDLLQAMNFKALFNELGWNLPQNTAPLKLVIQNNTYSLREIAQLAGVVVFEVSNPDGPIPGAQAQKAIHREISNRIHENLLIFMDQERTQSLWYYVKREGNKEYPREHLYLAGQPGDLFLGKVGALVFEIGDFEDKPPDVLDVANRLRMALDVERVTKRFYEDFKTEHGRFLDYIAGIDDERDRRWYASVLLNRLMFIYFLQRKWFLDHGNQKYLQVKLAQSRERGTNRYYSEFLSLLFFEGFAKPKDERSEEAKRILGEVVYLNGGLFLLHPIEKRWPNITIPDIAFEQLLDLFSRYTWNLDDTPGGDDDEISPHVLGYIFEKYINQKFFGAYYTRPEITQYLCERTIHKLILEKINAPAIPGTTKGRHFETLEELLMNLDARLCRDLLDALPKISILDPACGSGAFLVSAMNTLTIIYGAITGKIDYLNDAYLHGWLQDARAKHNSLNYYIKKKIITENLFGVDIMEEATEIAKLRLFLALVSSVRNIDDLEPLPNIDFNILPGNSLIGLLHVDENRLKQLNLLQKSYHEVVAEKNRRIQTYRETSTYTKDLRALRDGIQALREEAIGNLNELLLDDFKQAGVKYEQATWDTAKNTDGRIVRRALQIHDIAVLHPFHWGYEFDQVMQRGGFDVIITNPPWEILKPQAKEFFALHSDLVTKNKMRIEDFETEKARLLQDSEVRATWLDYQNTFPYQSAYYRTAPQYTNQISVVDGKKQGTDINLYKLFTEQCYNLLRTGGQCGIVIPSGIYTDLGARQLRELLFEKTQVTGLFCFENRKLVFEGVDSRFKFVVLTYEKGGETHSFPATFMRHDVAELERFPRRGALELSVELIRRLSPSSLSVMEFKDETDVSNTKKMLQSPLLGARPKIQWHFALTNEFHMTNDSFLFRTRPDDNCWPLYEGKMIHQYTHKFGQPRYWVDVNQGRSELIRQELRRVEKALDEIAILQGDINYLRTREERVSAFLNSLGYPALSQTDVYITPDAPRLAFRDVARNTDERTLIATILPAGVFTSNTLNYVAPWYFDAEEIFEHPASVRECYVSTFSPITLTYLCGVFNSFVLDYYLRFKVTAHVNMFYLYQLPVPRLDSEDAYCRAIAERVARLICIGTEYDDLRRELLGDINTHMATDPDERSHIQSEIDGLVAHLYGLSEKEFEHVLSAFPLVKQPIKDAALSAYHEFALAPDDLTIRALIEKGENEKVEFKVAACWNAKQGKSDPTMRDNIIQEVAAFLNTNGGTVLIGVEDNGTMAGLADDYQAVNPTKPNRDSYQLFLLDILRSNLICSRTLSYTISFGTLHGKDVCRIDIKPANDPVYLKNGDFYIREANRKLKLTTPEQIIKYSRSRWSIL